MKKMTIREVLDADWTVDRIDAVVRGRKTTRYIMRYCIGRDVKPGRSQRFACETEYGDMYQDSGKKTLFMNRTIQYRQLDKKPQGKELCVGVLDKEIPKEILDLTVGSMYPYHCGHSDDMHGYHFECYVDEWGGISGGMKQTNDLGMEDMQMTFADIPGVMP